MRMLLGLFAGSTALAVANWFGWWQVTFLVGGLCGLLTAKGGRGAWTSLVTGAVGWGAPLLVLSQSALVYDMAALFGRMIGLGDGGAVLMLLVPSLFGALLSLMASWIVIAVKGVIKPSAMSVAEQKGASVSQGA